MFVVFVGALTVFLIIGMLLAWVFYNALLDGIRSTICEYGRGCEKEAYALAEKITLFLAGE